MCHRPYDLGRLDEARPTSKSVLLMEFIRAMPEIAGLQSSFVAIFRFYEIYIDQVNDHAANPQAAKIRRR